MERGLGRWRGQWRRRKRGDRHRRRFGWCRHCRAGRRRDRWESRNGNGRQEGRRRGGPHPTGNPVSEPSVRTETSAHTKLPSNMARRAAVDFEQDPGTETTDALNNVAENVPGELGAPAQEDLRLNRRDLEVLNQTTRPNMTAKPPQRYRHAPFRHFSAATTINHRRIRRGSNWLLHPGTPVYTRPARIVDSASKWHSTTILGPAPGGLPSADRWFEAWRYCGSHSMGPAERPTKAV